MVDVLIVGGGPAGLTAGLYAARGGKEAVLLEKLTAGGQMGLTDRIENYPGFSEGVGGPELCMAMEAQAVSAGLKIEYEAAEKIDCAGRRVRTASGWREARRLVLALGARAKRLGVAGEDTLVGRGVSFCATCDGALYRGRRVAVIGGGNTAAEEALYLAGIGCQVLMVHRRDTLRAEKALAQRVLANERITVLWNSGVAHFEGEGRLTGMRLDDGRTEAVDAAFIAIGKNPDTELVRGQLAMDAQGFIVAADDCRTSATGVYVAGDARTKALRQIVTAVADGAMAVQGLDEQDA